MKTFIPPPLNAGFGNRFFIYVIVILPKTKQKKTEEGRCLKIKYDYDSSQGCSRYALSIYNNLFFWQL